MGLTLNAGRVVKYSFKPILNKSDKNVTKRKNDLRQLIDSKTLKTKALNSIYKRINNIKELLSLPVKNEQINLITQKAFTSTDFLVWICEKETVREVNLAVYRMNQKNVCIVIALHRSINFKLNIVLSSFFKTSKRAEVWHDNLAKYVNETENCKMCYCVNHAKIIAIETTDNNYVVDGSGNMSDNARIEQYSFNNSKDLFDFHSNWIKELCYEL